MPTISQEILMMLCEGAFRLLTFRSLFSFGWLSNYPTYYRTIERLEKDGLLLREKQARDVCLRLTDQGKLLLGKHRQCRRESHQAWDRRWRLVIFDVPEKRKDVRPRLRRFLSALGFGRVQKSVWMAPYDYEKQVQEFARRLDMHQYIFQMTVERFRGLDKRELAGSFWDIRGLHDQYQSLIQSYSK
jgi:phenylacetic acid degradation operon negative regulatory protein